MWVLKNIYGEYLISYSDRGPHWGKKEEALKIPTSEKKIFKKVFSFCIFEKIKT